MTYQPIIIENSLDSDLGDDPRNTKWLKINANFADLYSGAASTAALSRNLTAQAGLRTTQVGSPSINGAPFAANDVSILCDIGVSSLNPLNLWTDVLNNSMVPILFASAPSGTSGTLSNSWPYQTSTSWTVVLSTGQTITGCTLTNGSTAVTLGSSVTGSPNTQATGSIFTYTSETGSSISNTTGYVPGSSTGVGANGCISATGFDQVHGATGTVYVKLARQAVSVDSAQSSTSVWYEGSGNTANGSPGSYPPTPWCFIDITGNSYAFFSSEFTSSGLRYGAPGQRATYPFNLLTLSNTPLMGANFDPTYIELIFTWKPITLQVAFTGSLSAATSATLATTWPYQTGAWLATFSDGTVQAITLTYGATSATWGSAVTATNEIAIPTSQMVYYVDGMVAMNSVLQPNNSTGIAGFQAGQFYQVGIGNNPGGASQYLGGCLGSFAIQRFQISSAFYPPPISDCIVGFLGDSYTAGGPSNSGNIAPGIAAPGSLSLDLQILRSPDNPLAFGGSLNIYPGSPFFSAAVGAYSTLGEYGGWINDLEAYSKKNLGYYFKALGACKSGFSSYWTGSFPSPMATPTPAVRFTGAVSSATSATISTVTINGVQTSSWPLSTGQWTVTFPDGTTRLCLLTLNTTSCTWTGSLTEANAATQNSTVYTTGYWDALAGFNPEIIIYWDNVNNGYECPNTTGAGTTPVADTTYIFNYVSAKCANLRAIIFLEMASLEKFNSGVGGSLTPAQWATVSASWRSQLRAAYNAGSASAAAGSTTFVNASGAAVPLLYVPTYENFTGASNGTQFLIGSNTNNPCTTGSIQGPSGAAPNIHPSPDGAIKIADLAWPVLKPFLQNRQQWVNA